VCDCRGKWQICFDYLSGRNDGQRPTSELVLVCFVTRTGGSRANTLLLLTVSGVVD